MELTKYEIGQIFGYIATFFSFFIFIPQVIHVYKTKDTYAINKCYLNLEVISTLLKIIYAILIDEYPLIISNISVLASIILIYIQKLKENPREDLESNVSIKPIKNKKNVTNI
jgi:MtN3 and saliva related transmembrane protein